MRLTWNTLPVGVSNGVRGFQPKIREVARCVVCFEPQPDAMRRDGLHFVANGTDRVHPNLLAASAPPHRRQRQRTPLVARLASVRGCPFPQWLGVDAATERRRPSLLLNGTMRPLLIGSTPRYHLQRFASLCTGLHRQLASLPDWPTVIGIAAIPRAPTGGS